MEMSLCCSMSINSLWSLGFFNQMAFNFLVHSNVGICQQSQNSPWALSIKWKWCIQLVVCVNNLNCVPGFIFEMILCCSTSINSIWSLDFSISRQWYIQLVGACQQSQNSPWAFSVSRKWCFSLVVYIENLTIVPGLTKLQGNGAFNWWSQCL